MADFFVSVHELKARLSEYLTRSSQQKERIIIKRREKPIAMIVPLQENAEKQEGGLATVPWENFQELGELVEAVYKERHGEIHREVPF
ncbi:MAG: type II toxin-antitoxin system Phd/YefM family antitoxin [Treponemataceae bacterium]|uniref:type II toxin-antitoxin system Phd/YefM family antitoxin n=1 Tax=Treponema sp. J25 TaxID=2094121 RepID=UPI001404C2DB|nr:type II toxin-antitoxin system prevent-host-death family antitoxin [Treponema sp. J25]MCX7949828.1 type II toxin-antitoxin system Phd/YefM family antitoxin [Treponemataceae bacterium]